ncbi:hypothetical protein KQI84_05595 [bacterium]|nr:hypothetical protein [bacterium]
MTTRFTRFLMAILALALVASTPIVVHAQVMDQKTREERIKEHEERVRKIIEERRQQRLEQERQRQLEEVENRGQPQPDQPKPEEQQAEEPAQEEPRFGTVLLYVLFYEADTDTMELDTVVTEGDRFLSEVRLQNDNSVPFDRVRLALKYDKRFIKPLRVFDDELRPFLQGDPIFKVNQRDSILIYDARFKAPRFTKQVPVLKIVWEAIRPTEHTGLDFEFASGETEQAIHTGVYQSDRNILGDESDPLDGVLGGSVLVMRKPSDNALSSKTEILQGKKEELRELYLGSVGANQQAGIALEGPSKPIVVGETFDVDVVLNNPDGAIIDTLRFFIHFNPDLLEVVDSDKGNWIKRGINVLDGPFRSDYPFDFHKRNEADNVRGLINYSMALGDSLALPTGTFARIRFRARQPIEDTTISLIRTRQGAGALTAIQNFGFDLFTPDPELSVPDITVAISAEPMDAEVASAGEGEVAPEEPVDPSQASGMEFQSMIPGAR